MSEAREKKVKETVDKLREKHRNLVTQVQCPFQYQSTSVFARAGASGGVQRQKTDSGFA